MNKYNNYHNVSGLNKKVLDGSSLKKKLFNVLKKKGKKSKLLFRLYGLPFLERDTKRVLDIVCGS